jgi:hypothetical protein
MQVGRLRLEVLQQSRPIALAPRSAARKAAMPRHVIVVNGNAPLVGLRMPARASKEERTIAGDSKRSDDNCRRVIQTPCMVHLPRAASRRRCVR